MCYAIPGKITDIQGNLVLVDYFGEKRRARNDFYDLSIGDYIYAQGGFVIQKVSEEKAIGILSDWKELFFQLQKVDSRSPQSSKNLYQTANLIRQKYHGNSCCIHGIIEFSNYCRNDCLYCGLRRSNSSLDRYRMDVEEIVESTEFAINKLGFKALVLQSGEDLWYNEEKLVSIIRKIREKSPCLLILSIGEREVELYERLYEEGARGILLRFETSNPSVYKNMRPGHLLEERIELIQKLKDIGFLTMTGFLIGLPKQTQKDILDDIQLTHRLGVEMFSFGPFIPHPQTPLADSLPPSVDSVLGTIAQARIKYPKSKILVTTSLETLDKENGLKFGLLSGANSLMINVTPVKYRLLYEIYPDRAGTGEDVTERIDYIVKLLHSLGRAPTDLGL